jgi:hypothetical protein
MESIDDLSMQSELRNHVREYESLVRSHTKWAERAKRDIMRRLKEGEPYPGAEYVLWAWLRTEDALGVLQAMPYFAVAQKAVNAIDLVAVSEEKPPWDFVFAAAWLMSCWIVLDNALSVYERRFELVGANETAALAIVALSVVEMVRHEFLVIMKVCDALTQQVMAGGNRAIALATALTTARLRYVADERLYTATRGNRDILIDEAMQETVSIWPDLHDKQDLDIDELRNAVSRGIAAGVDRHTLPFGKVDQTALNRRLNAISNAISMEDQFEAKELARQLIASAKLTQREQEMVNMRYNDDLTQNAIADKLG